MRLNRIGGAARCLGVPPPSIVRVVQELEHELGVILFERRANGMVPTAMGEAFLRRWPIEAGRPGIWLRHHTVMALDGGDAVLFDRPEPTRHDRSAAARAGGHAG